MTYPFIKKAKGKLLVRLNKELYPKKLIKKAAESEPESVLSISSSGNYHLLELDVEGSNDYLDFLNYLIYLKQG